jgi:hypothetical protein
MGFSGGEVFLCVNAPMVVGETIENESIILHHGTGQYFSTRNTGALIWDGLERGLDVAAISSRLQTACGITGPLAAETVLAFIEVLRAHDLIKDGPGAESTGLLASPAPMAFEAPTLEVHDDLADMLLLDPIHEVTDDGWPNASARA